MLATWMISYEQVKGESEGAADLLRLWGFLDNSELWYGLVAARSDGVQNKDIPQRLSELAETELGYLDAMRVLSRYSLVEEKATLRTGADEDEGSHSMHAVLHRWCNGLVEGREREVLGQHAARLVSAMVPGETEHAYWKLGRRLLSHARRVYDWILREPQAGADGVEVEVDVDVSFELGYLFMGYGYLREAEKMYERAPQGKEKAWGRDHTSTLNTVNNLGNLYKSQGKLDKAEKMYERALQGYEKALGPSKVGRYVPGLNTAYNLGILFRDVGQSSKAKRMFSTALAGYEKVFGHDHTECEDVRGRLNALKISDNLGA